MSSITIPGDNSGNARAAPASTNSPERGAFHFQQGPLFHNFVLADEISPDSCRLWDLQTGEKMDKDRFRRDLGGIEEDYAFATEVILRVRRDESKQIVQIGEWVLHRARAELYVDHRGLRRVAARDGVANSVRARLRHTTRAVI